MKEDISESIESASEKEINILKAINKYGSLKKKDIFRMFGENKKSQKSFCAITLNRMKEKKMIRGNRLGCYLGSTGIKILESFKIEKNYDRVSDKFTKLYSEAEYICKFPNRYILSRIEYLKNFTIMEDKNRTRMFTGVVWDNIKNKELVYILNSEMNNVLNSFINYDAKLTDIYSLIIAIDNINQLITCKEKTNSFNAKVIKMLPKTEEGILIYDLDRKGYLNDKYLVEFLNESNEKLDIKFKENILKINDIKTENFLMFDLKKLYQKTEKIRYVDERNCIFIYFEFFKDFFEDTSNIFFNDFSTEISTITIKLDSYISFLEEKYNYRRFNFNSLSSKTPYNANIIDM